MTGKSSYSLSAVKPRQSLFQTAQDEIKTYIIRNSLKPGDPLPPETELAQQLNISRNSVREAVKALEAVGIVEARVGAGLFVRAFSFDALFDNLAYGIQFDAKSLGDVLEVRHLIEYGMARRVLRAKTPDQIFRLRTLLDRMRAVAELGQYVSEHDQAFHQVLYENVDNIVLRKILDVFWKIYRGAQQRVDVPEPVNPMTTYRRHEEIVTALDVGDITALQAAMACHWSGIEGRIAIVEAFQQLTSGEQENPT